jgi:hypothetical protein
MAIAVNSQQEYVEQVHWFAEEIMPHCRDSVWRTGTHSVASAQACLCSLLDFEKRRLLCDGGNRLNVDGLFRSVKFSRHHNMRGRELFNDLGVVNDPDCMIGVCHKNRALGLPLGVPHGSTTTPTFLHAIRAAGLGVLGSATLVTDPAPPGVPGRADTDASVTAKQTKGAKRTGLRFICSSLRLSRSQPEISQTNATTNKLGWC